MPKCGLGRSPQGERENSRHIRAASTHKRGGGHICENAISHTHTRTHTIFDCACTYFSTVPRSQCEAGSQAGGTRRNPRGARFGAVHRRRRSRCPPTAGRGGLREKTWQPRRRATPTTAGHRQRCREGVYSAARAERARDPASSQTNSAASSRHHPPSSMAGTTNWQRRLRTSYGYVRYICACL